VRRDFMQRLFVVLHGMLGSYLRRDALQKGGACEVARLLNARPYAFVPNFFFSFHFQNGGFRHYSFAVISLFILHRKIACEVGFIILLSFSPHRLRMSKSLHSTILFLRPGDVGLAGSNWQVA
jgi:hypothetical protein